MSLIRGDELVLRYATLQGSGESPRTVDFVGYPNDRSARKGKDDRNRLIDTASLRPGASRFQIRSHSGAEDHGQVEVILKEPKLANLSLRINGNARVVEPGQILTLKRSDTIEVDSISTSIPEIDSQVRIAMDPIASPMSGIEINLFYRTYAFASIKVLLHPGGE